MDVVNKTLLISLKQDIKTLNEVIENIPHSSVESNEIRSWLFPTKSAQFVNEFIYHDVTSKSDNFRRHLELIVDRLYVGIRLILVYIDTKTQGEARGSQFVYVPKHLTLGFTFQTLWKIVSDNLVQKISDLMKKEMTSKGSQSITSHTSNKQIQTDSFSLNKCDSCYSAMLCMKNLLLSFDSEKSERTSTSRPIIRPQIYDITQFGCMLQTTSTIESGVNSLFEKLFAKEQENDVLNTENEKLKLEVDAKSRKITLLEKEVDIFKEKYEKGAIKLIHLSNKNEVLLEANIKNEFERETLQEVINNLNNSMKSNRQNMLKLTHQQNIMNNSYYSILKKQTYLVNIESLLQSKLTSLNNEQACIKDTLRQFENIIDKINTKLNTVIQILSTTKMKIDSIHKDHQDNSDFVMSKLKKIKESVQKTVTEICIYEADSARDLPSTFHVKGNPIEDLSRQIEENNEKIKMLQTENVKLQNIIIKCNGLNI